MLRIMNVALSDGGIYTCIARTGLDEMNATALLTVLGETGLGTIEKPASRDMTRSWIETPREQLGCLVCAVADVPDAPLKAEISEIRSPRNISLSWVPGSDHNSSVTGKPERRRRNWRCSLHFLLH